MGVFWLKHIPATFSVSPVPGKQNGMLTQVNTMFLNSFFLPPKLQWDPGYIYQRNHP